MENRNTLIAVALMFAVWIGFTVLYPPVTPQEPPSAAQPVVEAPARVEPAPLPPAVSAAAPTDAVREDRYVAPVEVAVVTDLYRIRLTSAGAGITSLLLREYSDTPAADSPSVAMVVAAPGRANTLRTTGGDSLSIPADLSYAVSEAQVTLSGLERREVVFTARMANGLVVEKIYTFSGSDYYFQLDQRVTNTGDNPLQGNLSLALVEPFPETTGTWEAPVGPVTFADGSLQVDSADDLAKGSQSYGRGAAWSGSQSKYFLSAILPQPNAAERLRIERVNETAEISFDSPYVTLAPGSTQTFSYLVYYGPRETAILGTADPLLAEAVDFGFFSPISRPLLTVLNYFYSFVGNYGVAIILLTVIIKLLFWPLTHKSYASMKAMQQLQPEMQKIREKFKNDKEKLNRELMELYKNRRVNPLGGCLPMLVQIPVFFALYKVLMESIEMRHADFFLWITDLSAKDPYYVTPLIMGATMFIQQKLTPTTMDPMQAKLFMFMPIVFTFLFLNFPSGLVLYWLVNNLLTIVQQVYIHRKA